MGAGRSKRNVPTIPLRFQYHLHQFFNMNFHGVQAWDGTIFLVQCKGKLCTAQSHSFYSFEDFKNQLAVHSRKYNNFPMRPLNWKSPADYVKAFLTTGEVF